MVVESSGTQAATVGTEHTLASPSTGKTRVLLVDVAALTAAETVELRIKAPVLSGGTVRVFRGPRTYAAGELEPYVASEPCPMPFGGTFTLKQIGGTGRSFPWSVVTLD